MGWEDWNVALVQPGKVHSELRSLLMKGLNTSVIPSYDTMVERIVGNLLLKPFVGQALEPRDLIEEYVRLPK
jgi:cytochrome P450